jgi:uncharacterized repeat protein (TIGR02543 family)
MTSGFEKCIKLEKITLPEGITSIGAYAFGGCSSLKEITIPDNVTSIGASAFNYTGITTGSAITMYKNLSDGSSSKIKNISICGSNSEITLNAPNLNETVEASADTLTPTVGAADAVTLTVKDSAANIENTSNVDTLNSMFGGNGIAFNGQKTVTISGVTAASDGSYGSVSYNDGTGNKEVDLTSDAAPTKGQTITMNFVYGQATCYLKLNNASRQCIEFNVNGVTNTSANTLNITPVATFKITYDGNGSTDGTVPADTNSYSVGTSVTIKDAGTASKTDYTFAGWNTKADGTGTSIAAGSKFYAEKNTTLYAQWKLSTPNSSISPITASFDKNVNSINYKDIAVTMTLNGNTLSSIMNGTNMLVSGTDYTVSGSTVTIKKTYLASQAVGTTNLTFKFSAGADQVLAVMVADTTPGNSSIVPTTASFDKYTSAANYKDIAVTTTLNGNTLSSIMNGTNMLVSGTDYTVSGSTVTIKKTYLASQAVGTTNLTFKFSAGADQVLAVTVADTTAVKSPIVNSDDSVTFSYQGDNTTTSVNLAGDMNGWSATATSMTKGVNNLWSVTNGKLIPGKHEYKFVVNDSNWITDPLNSNQSSGGNSLAFVPGFYAIKAAGQVQENQTTQVITVGLKADGTDENISNVNWTVSPGDAASIDISGVLTTKALPLDKDTLKVTITGEKDGVIVNKDILIVKQPGYVPPYIPPTPQPTTETRQVPVVVKNGGQQSTAVQTTITRTTDTAGVKTDTVKFDENTAAETVKEASEAKSTHAAIDITDTSGNNASKAEFQLSAASMNQLANNNVSLTLKTEKASLEIPAETINKSKGQDTAVQISEEKDSSKIADNKGLVLKLASGSQIVTPPLNIEANFTGRVKITIPIDASKLPSSKEELENFISSLAVMVHHSDGEDVVDKGTIVYDEKGNAVGIFIYVDKFSSFTLIEIPKDYFHGRTTVMPDKAASDKEWQIKFTKAADAVTVTKENVYVVDSKGNKVDVKVSYGSDNILKVVPVNPYTSGETYYLYISKAVKSKDRTSLVNELRYQFTVK